MGLPLSGQENSAAIVVIMGATGTGKSTFINLLTNDDQIHIGHHQESETFGVQMAHYIDQMTRRPVLLIDTPGFDDSREGVTDIDILEKVVQCLEPQGTERIMINGIIYMHRISDPRVSGTSRKNIKMFHSLCGAASLENVRIVTTNWSRVGEEEGDHREADLKQSAFKGLIDAGAQMRRHTNTLESARQIMSEIIPLKAVTMKIQEELRAGKKLAETAAGKVLMEEMREMEKRQERELADLKREMDDAEKKNDRALRAELEEERKAAEKKMAYANDDRKRLDATLDVMRMGEKNKQVTDVLKDLQARYEGLMSSEHQSTEHLSKESEPKPSATTDPEDDMAGIQSMLKKLRAEHAQLQQMELDMIRTRQRDSQEEERHIEWMRSNLQILDIKIRIAEGRKRERNGEWVGKVMDGFFQVVSKFTW